MAPHEGLAPQYYPKAALHAGIEGAARLDCVLDARGIIRSCDVRDEDPPGWGFGQAAIAMMIGVQVEDASPASPRWPNAVAPVRFKLPFKPKAKD
jgi:TonB family protein